MALIPKRLQKSVYSDFPKTFDQNPVSTDVLRITDVAAVKESLKNLILTDRGERLFNPAIGCNIRKLLFDNFTPDTIITAKEMIKTTIELFEPRCMLNDVNVLSSNEGSIDIVVMFNVINIEKPIEYVVTLKRVR